MHRPRRRRIVVASRPPHVANESSPKRNFERAYIGDSVHSARPLGARRFLMAEVRTSGLSRRGGCTRPQASQEASRTSSANPQQCCFLAPRRSSLRSRFRVVRPPIVISQIRSPSLALSVMPCDPPAHRESSRGPLRGGRGDGARGDAGRDLVQAGPRLPGGRLLGDLGVRGPRLREVVGPLRRRLLLLLLSPEEGDAADPLVRTMGGPPPQAQAPPLWWAC